MAFLVSGRMLTIPNIPPFLFREHNALAVYIYLLGGVEPTPRRVIRGGKSVEIGPFEFADDANTIAGAVGLSPELASEMIDLLADVGLLFVDSTRNVIQVVQSLTASAREAIPLPEATPSPEPPSSIRDFFGDYLRHVEVTFSRKTHRNASRVLTQFAEFIGERPISSLGAEDLERFKASRKGLVRDTTINIDIRTIKAAFSVAADWKRIPYNPFATVKQIRTSEQKAKGLTDSDFERLMAVIKEEWFWSKNPKSLK